MNLVVRPATEDDCKLVFDWANEPEVRNASFHSEKIEWPEHTSWFLQKLKNPNSLILIFEVDGSSAGQIRFDKNIDEDFFLISFLIDKKFRGNSLGKDLIAKGIDYLVTKMPTPLLCVGFVKKDNIASQRAFLKNEFQLVSESDVSLKFEKTIL
ncbi:GNAT family N-acetyltransferase [Leptospira sp. 2 VSF19]|uniref:GNAT family N-acetyltransferase n=1 Tax=Leptospira soteropolitanensis TaxID=2950025 RepID=A0AAW5VKS9_9LEPT|nr:GNAT family N-acetyltransferase [Leptospira soteropolitanensis]MCW7493162.1 GNAT family N-acetyltransferase [Leptospira soteropolitanensis]MCW7500769.1 GNAT family N-acetyltransferase [Leptospira soteropolitanensis]MCW7523012.1 GNAT family N-acetyltransferase [Leptospira soteropolitanensis]MCW7526881.1 GNAT family N-acetyltransferase [Leptospira soteropolitanensis]MCW7530730.1 GNAT family N-acetyltransferase [Leptospira soteropolitanensis]